MELSLSVRKIVELVLRSGNIDNQFRDMSAMYLGAAAHRKIQKQMGENYQKEVSLTLDTQIFDIPVTIRGRADGIITEPCGAVTIDEIKTTTLPLDHIFEQHEQHISQAKCYAHMYLQGLENPPETVAVQLTYFQLETEEIRRHTWNFAACDLAAFFADLLRQYGIWLRFEREWKITRNESIAALNFPFPAYRKGQRELAVAVYRTISAGRNLYACAPTGIGKTLSSIFPSIKAMGEEKTAPLFYLTAKTVTRTVAEEAVRLMTGAGLRFKSITLRAKEKICINEQCICNPENCEYAKGHFDRVNAAILDLLENSDLITPAETEVCAQKHRVCPHELALDTALWCDMIIGDYNHVFHPDVYLRRFFDDEKRDYVFLIDEAHNLADRVRDMYSAALRKSAFSQIRTALKDKDAMSKGLRKCFRELGTYFSAIEPHVSAEIDTAFVELIRVAAVITGEWLSAKKDHELHEKILELFFEMNHFILISEIYDVHYTSIMERFGRDTVVTLFCLDPSKIIAGGLARAKSSILFSATLIPLPYYREILGGGPEDYMVSLPSPFDPARLQLISHCGISTKYRDRDSSYGPIVQTIYETVTREKGNYLIFFPSYEYMHKVYELFCEQHPEVETLLQTSEMSEPERAEFLARFDSAGEIAGFAVLGGIFSEGIDLVADRLIGAVIVGVGMPKLSMRQDLIRDYFNAKNGQGYDYAYVFPGMNKVLQAAGRVIRTEEDRGIVVLIDSRYATAQYRGLFPKHWAHMKGIRVLPLPQ